MASTQFIKVQFSVIEMATITQNCANNFTVTAYCLIRNKLLHKRVSGMRYFSKNKMARDLISAIGLRPPTTTTCALIYARVLS